MGKLKSKIVHHLRDSWWVYTFVGACFIAGLIFGALGVNALDDRQTSSLREFLERGFSQFRGTLNFNLTTRQAIAKNLYNLGKICLLGLTVIGFPFILVIIFTRGFTLGFTIVFLIKEKSLQGGALALLAILPPNILSLPAYIIAAVIAINFSLYLVKGRYHPHNTPLSQYFCRYLLVMLGLCLIMTGSAFIEGYFSPLIIQLLN